jgi:hypothetical protein
VAVVEQARAIVRAQSDAGLARRWRGDDAILPRREGDADALPELPPQDADDPRGLPALRRAQGGRPAAGLLLLPVPVGMKLLGDAEQP